MSLLLKEQMLEIEAPFVVFGSLRSKPKERVPEGVDHIVIEHSIAELVLKRFMNDHLEGVGVVVDDVKLHVVAPIASKGPAEGDAIERLECGCDLKIPFGVSAAGHVYDALVKLHDVVYRGLAEDEGTVRDGGDVVENHGVDANDGLYHATVSLLKYNFR